MLKVQEGPHGRCSQGGMRAHGLLQLLAGSVGNESEGCQLSRLWEASAQGTAGPRAVCVIHSNMHHLMIGQGQGVLSLLALGPVCKVVHACSIVVGGG